MRIHLLLSILFATAAASAELNITAGGASGPTHIDTALGVGYINYTTTVAGNTTMNRRYPKLGADGKYLANYFILTTKDAAGKETVHRQVIDNTTCEDLKKNNPEITVCEPHVALQVVLNEATGGATTAPTNKYLPVNLGTPAMIADLNKYSPDEHMVVITDVTGKSTIVARMDNKTLCDLPSKPVALNGSWNSDVLSQINTSPYENSFMVSDHTRYFFDATKKNWCYHFLPKGGEPICSADFNNMSFRINIAYKNPSTSVVERTDNKGIVQLKVDENGNASATIGEGKTEIQPTDANPRPPTTLDTSKPSLKINMIKNAGISAVSYQAFGADGTAGKKVTVSPNYTFGSDYSSAGHCDSSSCLSPIKELIPSIIINPKKFCSDDKVPFNLNDASISETCYSCNGVTPGGCKPEKKVITAAEYQLQMDTLAQCQSPKANTPVEPEQIAPVTPTTQQAQ